MAGLTDLASAEYLHYSTGQLVPAMGGTTVALGLTPPPEFLGLFTTAPTSDAGVTGAVEVSGGAYARLQVAGSAPLSATAATAQAVLTFSATPSWIWNGSACIAVGFFARVATPAHTSSIPAGTTIISATATTVTLSANIVTAGLSIADIIVFSAFAAATASSGAEPATIPGFTTNSSAVLNFVQSTASWGTVVAAGLFDAVTSGNCRWWDWLGNFAWKPFTCSLASPGIITCPAHGFSLGDNIVVSQKEGGGSLPSLSAGSWTGILVVAASVTTDAFTVTTLTPTALNTTSTGSGELRKVGTQPVPINITVTFPVNTLTLSLG